MAQHTLDHKAQPKVFATRRSGGGQASKPLCRADRSIGARGRSRNIFGFQYESNIAIVGVLIKQYTAPIGTAWNRTNSIIIRVVLRSSVRTQACSDGIILQARQDHREAWLAHQVQRAADSIVARHQLAIGGDSRAHVAIVVRTIPIELDDQRFIGGALQSQAPLVLIVPNKDPIIDNVNDVGIVPYAGGGQGISADLQTVKAVIRESVFANQWTLVRRINWIDVNISSLPSRIRHHMIIHAVRIDINRSADVVPEHIAKDRWLRPTDEYRSWLVEQSTESSSRPLTTKTIGVVFENRMRDASISLLKFNCIEGSERTVQPGHTSSVSKSRMVDAQRCSWRDVNATPIACCRTSARPVVVGVKRTASTVPIIQLASKDNRQILGTFGDDASTKGSLNTRAFQLQNATRIDHQG